MAAFLCAGRFDGYKENGGLDFSKPPLKLYSKREN